MAGQRKKCEHLEAINKPILSKKYECKICVEAGDRWVHLRTCQHCGITLCCDSSPNQHASKHAAMHKHPVISSAEPHENWMWCYIHQEISKYKL